MTDKLKFKNEAKPRQRHEKVADFAVVRKTDADPHVNHFWQPCCGAGWWIRDSVPQEKLLEGQPCQNKEQFETERCIDSQVQETTSQFAISLASVTQWLMSSTKTTAKKLSSSPSAIDSRHQQLGDESRIPYSCVTFKSKHRVVGGSRSGAVTAADLSSIQRNVRKKDVEGQCS